MNFSEQITKFVLEATASIEDTAKEIIFEVGDSLVTLTPVLTGRLKGNWQMTVGSPSTHSMIRYDKTGDATKEDIWNKVHNFELGQVAFIVNNLTYSEIIEYGGSPLKAPDGMLRVTEAKFEHIIKLAIENNRMN